MTTDIGAVLIAAGAAFGMAVGTLWLAKRAGLTDVQRSLRMESALLAETLKARLAMVEEENRQLKSEVAILERRYDRLEAENEELRKRLDRMEAPDGRD